MWTKEQESAINEKGRNLLVSASAGSGKTAVLVERVIKKVTQDMIDIDKILVVTFTNASAMELKERLVQAIHKELENNPKNLFLKKQLKLVNRASITTIHSFCLDIIRKNFDKLLLDPNFKIADDSVNNILKTKALNKVLEAEYEIYNTQGSKLYEILELFSGKDEKLLDYILKIYSYIQAFALPFEFLKLSIDMYNLQVEDLYETPYGKQIFDDAIARLKLLILRLNDFTDKYRYIEDFEKLIMTLENDIQLVHNVIVNSENNFDKLYLSLQNADKFARMPSYKGIHIEEKEQIAKFRKDVVKDEINKIKKSVYTNTQEILEDNKIAYEYLVYLYEFIKKFDVEYSKLKREKNVIDFNDIEHFAFELLTTKTETGELNPSEIALSLKEQFIEVYTDEYQDTSFVQESILNSISKSNNRFMVGDIKQSIYRFRQAMPEIFNEKYEKYPMLEKVGETDESCKIILAKNFRSRKGILDSINYIFDKLMNMETAECDYSELEQLKFGQGNYLENDANDYSTEINIIDLKEEYSSENVDNIDEVDEYLLELKDFEIEAIFIARKIKELIENFEVFDLKSSSFRNCEYKDIVILLRNIKDKGNILEQTLKKYQIPSFSDVSSSLFESDEVKLVVSFLKIIDNPLQDIHMISVLYSIIGNFSLSELSYIRNIDTKTNIYFNLLNKKEELEKNIAKTIEDNELYVKIVNFLNLLEQFRTYSKVYGVSDLLVRLYKDTPMYLQYTLENSSDMKKANLDLLIDIAKRLSQDTTCLLNEYIDYVDNLVDKQDNSTSTAKTIGENENVVRIMTIHKSKGLEFPVVILSDTSRKYNLMDMSNIITLDHSLGIGVNIVNKDLNVTYPSIIKQAIKGRVMKQTKAEELRMLYVALTRAKEKLIIFGTLKDYEKYKEEQVILYNDKSQIEPMMVLKNNNYLSNILMALNDYNKVEDNDKISLFKLNIHSKNDTKEFIQKSENQKIILNDKILNIKSKYIQDIDLNKVTKKNKIIYDNLETEYEFLIDTTTANRVSVSKLKSQSLNKANEDFEIVNTFSEIEIDYIEDIYDIEFSEANIVNVTSDVDLVEEKNKKNKFGIPSCIKPHDSKYTPVRKGILVHFVLENLDFKTISTRKELQASINNMISNNVITKEDAKYINITSIENFLNSSIGKELKNAEKIFKEEEFILLDENITKSKIIGVIDLYYYDKNDSIVLVDFKTDKITQESSFISKYKKQLEIYKIALEKLLNKPVNQVYIYSFYLNKKIKVEC